MKLFTQTNIVNYYQMKQIQYKLYVCHIVSLYPVGKKSDGGVLTPPVSRLRGVCVGYTAVAMCQAIRRSPGAIKEVLVWL